MCGTNNSGCILTEDDPSPPGISLAPGHYTYADPCPCVSEGKCPWCFGPLVADETDPDLSDFSEKSTIRCSTNNPLRETGEDECGWTWIKAMELASEPPDDEPEWYGFDDYPTLDADQLFH